MKQVSQVDQDLMELKALLDYKVLQDLQAHREIKDQMDQKAWMDSKATLDTLGGKAPRESGVVLEERVLMVSRAPQEEMALMDHLVIGERLGQMGLQEHQDLSDLQELPVHKAHLDPKVSRDRLVHLVLPARKDLQETQVLREKGENRVYQDEEVQRVPREKEEVTVPLVKTARKDRREHRVILVRLDHRDCQAHLEHRASLVRMEPMDPQEHRVRLEHLARLAYLARVENGVMQALLVNQGQEVLMDGLEGGASKEQWVQLVNKDLRVNVVPQEFLELQDFLAKMVLEENQEPMAEMDKRENGVQMVFQVEMVHPVQGDHQDHQVILDLMDEMAKRVLLERTVNQAKWDHRAL